MVYYQELVRSPYGEAEVHQDKINDLFIKYTKKKLIREFKIITMQHFVVGDEWQTWVTLELIGLTDK